ncbi:acetyl-CoA carboxylase, carboxyltransferase subunit beta [Nonomuraea jabiensis]|uniref:Multifunctional fusion protein n=1 Tax=Nonomuraea jabiensis TaxID=882448 RepID=A0A7W9LGQ5_9ACTN|nr:acetyl-CoA carboxylase, carboxyltransferase subunit beta [Nonomuraea jabiensis]MBB5783194.1 acetyl-CoA carboxylase carboxyl transferase subunit beta [Nonomuraea jabiensis]
MTATTLRPAATAPWWRCDGCGYLVYAKRLARSHGVCPECGHHRRIPAGERVELLLDPGTAEPMDVPYPPDDPLGFADTRPYRERLAEARARTGLAEAAIAARGRIGGVPAVLVVMEFDFLGGSLGGAVGELITVAAETALAERRPLVIVAASGGARMQEGALALMQMAKTSQALLALDQAGLPTVSVITDPTYGGVAASFATLCDVIVAEPGARMGFAGPRVIERTIGERLPSGFQTAEFLLRHGQIDAIRSRDELRPTLRRLLRTLAPAESRPSLAKATARSSSAGPSILLTDPDRLPTTDPYQVVRLARSLDRPTALDYVHWLVDDFEELRGDRLGGDCPATIGGVGTLDGQPIVVIGQQKGHDAAELRERNFGMPAPAGYRKAGRLMRLAAKVGIPVLTLVDTGGAYPGVSAEREGQAVAIAENLRLMAGLPVPIVSVVISEGGSGGALGLAVADRVLMLSNAVYSVISPEGCAAILWRDGTAAPSAARALGLDARDLLARGVVDAVLPEPDGGAQADPAGTAYLLGEAVAATLAELRALPAAELTARRRARFRRLGSRAVVG